MKNNKKRLIVIDSNSMIHRAFHALPPLTTKKGELVNAIYGFLLVFFKAVKEFQPDFIAAAFDLPGPTFRHKQFKEYKAKRPPTPKQLSQQIPKIKEILKKFNVPIFEKQGFEADDIIGTIARLASITRASAKSGRRDEVSSPETIILSGDSDAFQLVDSRTKVYVLRRGVKDIILYDKKLVKEKFQGLEPKQLLDFKALRGDPSDNIPGVAGVGEKTATKLIKEFRTLENLYKKIQNTKYKIKDTLKAKLLEGKEQAFLSKMLVEIKTDTLIDFNLEKCIWGNYNKDEIIKILKDFGFHSLIKKLSLSSTKLTSQNKLF